MQINLLNFIVICSLFLQSCASFAFGRKCPCEDVKLPPKPANNFCVALSNGMAFCPQTEEMVQVQGMVCREATEDSEVWIWIENAIEAIR